MTRLVLWAAIAVHAAGFSTLAVLRHRSFATGRFDLGNMVQAVWSTAHGRPLETTGVRGEQFVRLGAHFDPILAALAPLWLAWPSPELLLVVQAAALALGAHPVFRLAERHTGSERAALGLALAYLLHPALQWTALADFHPVALATPLLLYAIRFLDEDRLVAFAAAALAAMATKEHVGAAVAMLGLWYAVRRGPRDKLSQGRKRAAGVGIAVAGLAVSAVAVLVVVPAFSPLERSAFASRYDELSLSGRDLAYVAALLLPFAALPLAAPLLALAALPEIALNVLAETVTQTSIRLHYSAVALAPLAAAAAIGAARVARGSPRIGLVAAGVALGAAIALGPVPGLPNGLPFETFTVSAHDRAAAAAVARVPASVPVCATNSLGAHLSERRRVLAFPFCEEARWIAVDTRVPSYGDSLRRDDDFRAALGRVRGRRVFARDGVVVLRSESSAAGDTR